MGLTSFLDFKNSKCSTLAEKKGVAVAKLASLQEEVDRLKSQVEEATKRVEPAEKQVAEAKKKYLTEGKTKGYEKGKKEAELVAAEKYLNSEDFTAKCDEIVNEFMASEELTEIWTKDLQSAGAEIVKQIKQHHPEWDLGFLYAPPYLVDGDGSSQPGNRDGLAGGGVD